MPKAGVGALLAVAWMLLASTGAWADHNTTELMSTGPTGGNGAMSSIFRGTSTDGTRVFIQTTEKLVAADTDNSTDVYERAAGTTTQVSTGPSGGNGAFSATYAAASANGTRVFFRTAESMVASDTDEAVDIYERAAGVTTLISTGPDGGNGDFNAIFSAISQDGSRAFFTTDEMMVSSDTDTEADIHERSGGTTTLLSTGPADTHVGVPATLVGLSQDGTRVFFDTDEPLTSSDTDTTQDVYERTGSTTTHVTIGPVGGNGDEEFDYDAAFDGASANGTKVWFHTDEELTVDDTDVSIDVYERVGATVTRLSTGPNGGNSPATAFFGGASDDGTRVFFDTMEALTGDDTDTASDVYQRSGGTTTRISTGPAGGNGAFFASFEAVSSDGLRVIFQTPESLVASDTDAQQDVYRRDATGTTLISTSPSGGNAAVPSSFKGASLDGWRVFFETGENLTPNAGGFFPDLYERAGAGTTLLSTGPLGGAGAYFAFFAGASDDGTRVFFETAEVLVGADADASQDVYMSSSALGYARPKGATPLRVPLVPASVECLVPNRTHGPPLEHPSCNPPSQTSPYLTVGTPDANGGVVNSVGSVKLTALPGNAGTPADEADLSIIVSMTDVRQRTAGLPDYTGQLQLDFTIRITDKLNGAGPTQMTTGSDIPFPTTVPCTATGSTTIGATCAITTTADAVVAGAVAESKRAIWELGRIALLDGGADGLAATTPNNVFVTQGVLIP